MILVLQGVIILAIVSARMYVDNPYALERTARLLRRLRFARAPRPQGEEVGRP